MPADALSVILLSTSVSCLGALAVVVLPWRSAELTDSWLAWRVLVDRVRAGIGRLRDSGSVAVPRPVRSIG